ncbi:hypothetical protein JMJ77_0000064 [Colletotrichum scovillei]|uniref:Uncharacterized protein n=1 Tax=Colletotrichum scovillei TaxID=1209932 RepID=A0A9P7R9L7_9PEZI|nr:hypothetical protein JMJ77_0000064 [Colletotrichum scovillei]KAG7071262.1 hypothetical protein JMJ76_0004136 [Colletotrichum scovillei]KAG7079487.1 hypothetical protein JMJ78_0006595 [Colletotrichum scovillei]
MEFQDIKCEPTVNTSVGKVFAFHRSRSVGRGGPSGKLLRCSKISQSQR